MNYYIENNELIVRIDSFGAEVKSVLNKYNYTEYMWYADPAFWGRTSPVLFPFVGSVKDKKYKWKGVEYLMGQHGFARDMEFELLEKSKEKISFVLRSSEDTLRKYPFDFALIITYTLEGDTLNVGWTVNNTGSEKMYFSIGAHPAFLCPVHGEESKEGYRLYFEGTDVISHHGNTRDTGLATMDENLELMLTNNRATITKDFFDRCTYMIEGRQTKLVGLEDPQGNRLVDVIFDTPLFAVWSPEEKNAPFLCIEPWYGRADATDFSGDLSERDYTNELDAGESFNGGYGMRFYKIH